MAGSRSKDGIDKNIKYDRQLRLWGDHGQVCLESSRVCLINASATGTEILKNLILPGIGSFTVVDGHKVQGEDVGNNFFLTMDAIGKSRAKYAMELLSELNDDVTGDFMEEHPETLLDSNEEFFSHFTVVIATNLCEKTLLRLGKSLWNHNIPLLICRSYGLIGYIRLVVKEHTVIESHPDSAIEDLRLDRPFPSLETYVESINLSTLSKKDHSHIPWLIVLYKFLQEWKSEHGGSLPKAYREKNQLKELIRKGIRTNETGAVEDEDNFEEAVKAVNTALNPTMIPLAIEKLFVDPACESLHSESLKFWILVRAIRDFSCNEGKGALPLRGTIPDMIADSERYIHLQNIYQKQAKEDIAMVTQRVHDLQQTLGQETIISDEEIHTFCKNAAFLTVVRCRSLEEEYKHNNEKIRELGHHLDDEDTDDAVFYILLRAVDMFYDSYNSYPGYYSDQVESDVVKLKSCLSKFVHSCGLTCTVKDDFIHEMCRYGASELHTVAAFIGGAAAQEAIKMITHQFVPINNTYIYNAMKQTSLTLEL